MRYRPRPACMPLLFLSLLLASSEGMAASSRKAKPASKSSVKRVEQVAEPIASIPDPTPPIREEEGWKMIYAGGAGQKARGSLEQLLGVVQARTQSIGVMFPTFHGRISGTCSSVQVLEDGDLDCSMVVWCNETNDVNLPERHGHRAHLRTSGYVQYLVISHNERGEEKILGLGDADATVAWFVR